MASIRKLANGKWKAEIVIRRKGEKDFRCSLTDKRRSVVTAWADETEKSLRSPGGVERAKERSKGTLRVADIISRYLHDDLKGMGPSKLDYLKRISSQFTIGQADPSELTSQDIVDFARFLVKERGVKPSTASGYVSTLCEVLRLSADAYNVPVRVDEINRGRNACTRLGLTGKSEERERRPSLNELDELLDLLTLQEVNDPRVIPLSFIVCWTCHAFVPPQVLF